MVSRKDPNCGFNEYLSFFRCKANLILVRIKLQQLNNKTRKINFYAFLSLPLATFCQNLNSYNYNYILIGSWLQKF